MSLLLALAVAAKTRKGAQLWSRAKAMSRVVAYGTVVAMGISALAARNAVADVEEGSLRFGRELQGVADLLGDTQEVKLNGEKIYFSQGTSPDDVKTVLDRFQAHCDEDPAMRGVDWQDVAQSKLQPSADDTKKLGVMRNEQKNDGVVLCFRNKDKAQTTLEAIQKFNTTHDFGAIGDLRYVHVSREPGMTETSVQVVWTTGSFNVDHVMPPEDGSDAPGSDSATLPRPAHAQRILTATATGSIYSVRMYRTTDSADEALKSYDTVMDSREWAIIQAPEAVRSKTGNGHWYEHDGAQAMVSVGTDNDGRTVVTVADMGTAEHGPMREVTE